MTVTETTSKPRVLIFHPALAPYRIDLFNLLAEQLELRLVFLDENVPYQEYDQNSLTQQLNAPYRYLTGGFKVLGRLVRFGVSAEITRSRPSLVVTHEFSLITFRASAHCRRKGIPHVVWTADSPEVIESESPFRRLARRIIVRRIDGLVVYSEDTKSHYQRVFHFDGPVGICPNMQAENKLQRKLQDAATASLSLGTRYDLIGKKVILYVGRLAKVKRLDRLIDAFAGNIDTATDTVLAIVGDGPERRRLHSQVRNLGIESRVIFAGHCEGQSLYAWFNLGSLFVLTSEFEPWGAVVNEALIAGIPVICTSQAGARELLKPGLNGTVVDAGDAMALRTALAEWTEKVPPISKRQLSLQRNSLMTRKISDAVAGFMSPLRALLVQRETRQ